MDVIDLVVKWAAAPLVVWIFNIERRLAKMISREELERSMSKLEAKIDKLEERILQAILNKGAKK